MPITLLHKIPRKWGHWPLLLGAWPDWKAAGCKLVSMYGSNPTVPTFIIMNYLKTFAGCMKHLGISYGTNKDNPDLQVEANNLTLELQDWYHIMIKLENNIIPIVQKIYENEGKLAAVKFLKPLNKSLITTKHRVEELAALYDWKEKKW